MRVGSVTSNRRITDSRPRQPTPTAGAALLRAIGPSSPAAIVVLAAKTVVGLTRFEPAITWPPRKSEVAHLPSSPPIFAARVWCVMFTDVRSFGIARDVWSLGGPEAGRDPY